MRNSRGFTIIEVLVVIGITGVVIGGVMTLVSGLAQQSDLIFQKQRMDEIVQEINSILMNKDICSSNLRSIELKSNPQVYSEIKSISYYLPNGSMGHQIVTDKTELGGLKIENIRIRNLGTNDGATVSEIVIQPSYMVGITRQMGAPRLINRTVRTVNGYISECASINTDSSAVSVAMCTLLGKTYDSVTNKCIDPYQARDIKRFANGTSASVKCPDTHKPNPLNGWPCGCDAPRGYRETVYTERDFETINPQGGGPSPTRSDWRKDDKECRCTYATDIPDPEGSKWKASIECMIKGPQD